MRRWKILLLERNRRRSSFFQTCLELLGPFDVSVATPAGSSLDALRGFVPDAIVLNLDLAAEDLRRRLAQFNVPIVYVTAGENSPTQCLQPVGPVEVRRFSPRALIDAVTEAIGNGSDQDLIVLRLSEEWSGDVLRRRVQSSRISSRGVGSVRKSPTRWH